jgi:hypothetical protein
MTVTAVGHPSGPKGPAVGHLSGPKSRVEFWCRDLISCLQATFATVLWHAGHEPLDVLGAHWEFRYRPGDVRPEEFYYPCRVPGDLAASLAPHHPVSSAWQEPPAGADPLDCLAEVVALGRLGVAAVDNFYLPFRPAFGDVHAAHLVVVYGVDRERGQVLVSDAMPPAFRGPIGTEDFLRAWSSVNPTDDQDVFFSNARIDRRFMTLTIGEPFPELDPALLRQVLSANLAGFSRGGSGPDWAGMAGLERFLASLVEACRRGDRAALADCYPFGWGMQAQASLHAELLRDKGLTWDLPELREAGRLVEAAAHAWTGLRMTAAHGHGAPADCAADLARHAAGLRRAHELALAGLTEAVRSL